ncbi:hypothetical protein NE237_013525 [Protea cynaroides]|uniref:Uncharacterized protein n=1 Tax=Protea cynaroides TaxID=273540 RepID=A0A9Q0H363_9MAGN|nr:hypothetical protein NE237_013525 [Protea cynaroides]
MKWPLILVTTDPVPESILERQPFDLGKFIGLPPMEDSVADIGKSGNGNNVGSFRTSTRRNPARKKRRWLAPEKGKSAEHFEDILTKKMSSVEPDPGGPQTGMEEGDLLQKTFGNQSSGCQKEVDTTLPMKKETSTTMPMDVADVSVVSGAQRASQNGQANFVHRDILRIVTAFDIGRWADVEEDADSDVDP